MQIKTRYTYLRTISDHLFNEKLQYTHEIKKGNLKKKKKKKDANCCRNCYLAASPFIPPSFSSVHVRCANRHTRQTRYKTPLFRLCSVVSVLYTTHYAAHYTLILFAPLNERLLYSLQPIFCLSLSSLPPQPFRVYQSHS